MLTYHPSLDSYHCFFRVGFFLYSAEDVPYEIDKIRIIDFYLSSPGALRCFKFPAELRKYKKIFSDKVNDYNNIPNQRSLFFEMQHIQRAVFDMMLSIEIIDSDEFKRGKIYLLRERVTDDLANILEHGSSIDHDIKDFSINNLSGLKLFGPGGLKDRSGLMEYRYDVV